MKTAGNDTTKNLNDATLKSSAGNSYTQSLGIIESNKQIAPKAQSILSKCRESDASDIRLEHNTIDMSR
ncbi:IpaC/SipC family type III secretion system effector, partial [Salmonella enterica]|uniref:IpaC/SipC family type III secretion system effector n=1 Tax=Salmonella enterica TaxID=28901 RepID=UPI0026F1136D